MLSIKEEKRRKIASAVMKEAWRIHNRTILFTMNLSTSLKLAWKTIRCQVRMKYSKAWGVTFNNRQSLLWRLGQFEPKDIVLSFVREENSFDSNAVKIVAYIRDKGSAVIGYLQHELAFLISRELDSGKQAVVILDCVSGPGSKNLRGLNFKYVLI